MPLQVILTDTEMVGKGLSHRDNIQRINDNFTFLEEGGGEGPSTIAWESVTGRPTMTDYSLTTHTHTNATETVGGFMSGADKAKLNGIAANATALSIGTTATTAAAGNHTHTQYAATSHTHTAAQISDATAVGRSVLSATDAAAARTAIGAGTGNSNLTIGVTATTAAAGDHTHGAATTAAAGFMSGADKTKLDGIAAGATALSIGTTGTTAAAGNHTHGAVVAAGASGFMTGADKTKLDGISAGANAYTLPAAGAALGGVRQGAAVADADADAVVAINALLASLRAAGVIAT